MIRRCSCFRRTTFFKRLAKDRYFLVVVYHRRRVISHGDHLLQHFDVSLTIRFLHGEDALCSEVPLIFPGEKIGLKLFKVGSFTEYFFAAGLILLAYGLRLARGG